MKAARFLLLSIYQFRRWKKCPVVNAGLSLKNLKPRVMDVNSPYYLSDVPGSHGVLCGFSSHSLPTATGQWSRASMHISGILEGGYRSIWITGRSISWAVMVARQRQNYEDFVARAKPDWCPIPQDVDSYAQHDSRRAETMLHADHGGEPRVSARTDTSPSFISGGF